VVVIGRRICSMLVTIPKILREKLGEEAAEGLIELLNNFSEHTHNSVITLAAERFERRLAEEIGKFRSEVTEQNAYLPHPKEEHPTDCGSVSPLYFFEKLAAQAGNLF